MLKGCPYFFGHLLKIFYFYFLYNIEKILGGNKNGKST